MDNQKDRKELENVKTSLDGNLQLETTGNLVGGSAFSRLTDRLNERCPEYILGQMALKAGYKPGEKVNCTLVVSPPKR